MASGDAVVQVVAFTQPDSAFAPFDFRLGGSAPAERVPLHDFAAGVDIYLDFLCKLEGYDGGGLTFTTPWSAATAAAGVARFGIAIRAIPDDAEDIDGAHVYVFNEVDDTAPSASGEVTYPTIAFTDGADMDNWTENELAIVRFYRHGTHGNDNMVGAAELWALFGLET